MTVVLDDIVTVQSPLPAHAPLHPVKTKFGSAVACKVTDVPAARLREQAAPQSIPGDPLMTFPLPFLTTVMVTVLRSNFAVQVLPAFMVTEPSPQSASPVQPANLEFGAGMGVRTTTLPAG